MSQSLPSRVGGTDSDPLSLQQGSLVLQYLASHPERSSFELQAGGRSASKINQTIADAGLSNNGIKVVTFDLMNAEEVEKAVLGATVVIACAGPFFKYGTNLVRYVCVQRPMTLIS